MQQLRWILAGVCLLGLDSPQFFAQVAKPRVTLTIQEQWSNLFAGKDYEYHLTLHVAEPFQGRVQWLFTLGPAVVVRKEIAVAAKPDKPAQLNLKVSGQTVREGVILEGRLSVAVYAEKGEKPEATLVKPLWIFPHNPFADRTKWLKESKITLFDTKGTTTEVLKKMEVPFEEMRNVEAVAELKEGLLLIGEGTSFQEERGLAEAALAAAARGLPVLCLAPLEGSLPLPGTEGAPGPWPTSLSLLQQEIISRLDKRLDSQAWSADHPLVASRLVLKGDGARVIGEISRGEAGWPWLEVRFKERKGCLAFCGFGVMRHWETSPAPRFLLLRLLELLTMKDKQLPANERVVEK